MAGELATAIALDPQKPTITPIDLSSAADGIRANRAAKEAKAAKEAADRDKRFEEISKNTIFSKQFKNDIYNRQFQEVSKAKLDNIYKTYSEGGNLTVEGTRAIQELRDVGETLFAADTQMFNARTAHDKNPEELGWFSLGGKSGANIFATLDDPTYDGKVDEINADYENPAFNMRKVNVGGVELNVGQFNPAAGSTINGYKTAEQLISAEDATELVEDPNILSYQGNSKKRFYYTPSKDLATKTAILVSGDVRVGNDAVLQEYKKQAALAAQKGEYLSPSKFFETANIADITTNNADEIANKLSEKQYNQQYVNYSPSAPKEAKKPLHETKYNVSSTSVIDYGNKTANRKTFNAIGTSGSIPMYIPKDAVEVDEDGKQTASVYGGTNTEVSPIGIEWKDKKLSFLFSAKNDNTIIFAPASQGVFATAASGLYLNTPEEQGKLIQYIKEVVGDDPKALEKDFWKGLGVTDAQIKTVTGFGASPTKPAAKPAATTTKMNAQGKVTPASTPSNNQDKYSKYGAVKR